MTVLHVPFTYFPSSCGGTEVYVAALCRELSADGVTSVVAAPAAASSSASFEGVTVHRFAVDPAPSLEVLHGEGDRIAAQEFALVLEATTPDVVHFHANSPAVSHLALREVRKRGIPAIYTFHTPNTICMRGTLMRWGTAPCDGELRTGTCAACHLQSLSVPRSLALLSTAASPLTQHISRWLPPTARWQLPARALPMTRRRHRGTREWLGGMERIVTLNEWSAQVLKRNGVPAQRLRKIRHGLPFPATSTIAKPVRTPRSPLRFAFLGRLDPVKGLGLIADAIALVPGLAVELHLYTIAEFSPSAAVRALRDRLTQDPRIHMHQPVPPGKVVETIAPFDALLVPSQWLETGPLVVLEAFAAGLPVIGSNLGGIAEWVVDQENGLLLPHDSPSAWAAAWQSLSSDPALLERLRQNIHPPPSMREVAREMHGIYRDVLTVPLSSAPFTRPEPAHGS